MNKIVDFMCVGAPKSGTSSLHHILVQHPDIYLPEIKETTFFLLDDMYERGLDYYEKEFFSKKRMEKIAGEIDPSYFFPDHIAKRVYQAFGEDLKLIFMFRNPIDRAYSHYWMNVRRFYEDLNFVSAIEKSYERCRPNVIDRKYCYVQMGLYAERLKNFLQFFKKENMFFIIFEEDFILNREDTIKKLLKFLGVDSNVFLNLNVKANPARLPKISLLGKLIYHENFLKVIGRQLIKSKIKRVKLKGAIHKVVYKEFTPPKLKLEDKLRWINKFFINDIKELEKLINRDLAVWYSEQQRD